MDNCCKSLDHILWRTKLGNILKPPLELVCHSASNVIARNLCFVINEGLTPDFSIHFVVGVQMLAYVILAFGDFIHLLLTVNVHSTDGLTKVRATFFFIEFG